MSLCRGALHRADGSASWHVYRPVFQKAESERRGIDVFDLDIVADCTTESAADAAHRLLSGQCLPLSFIAPKGSVMVGDGSIVYYSGSEPPVIVETTGGDLLASQRGRE